MSLTSHRITGSKEAATLSHRCGIEISYTDVRFLSNTWAKDVSMNYNKILKTKFSSVKSIHVTFDNSDGEQQKLTGFYRTPRTTGTVFETNQPVDTDITNHTSLDIKIEPMKNRVQNYGNYKIPPKKETIQSFPDFDDRYANLALLDIALLRDIAWAIINSVASICVQKFKSSISIEELKPVGS